MPTLADGHGTARDRSGHSRSKSAGARHSACGEQNARHRLAHARQTGLGKSNPIAIDSLLLILLDNAIKYTPDGGFCEIELLPGPQQIQVLVRDSGIGIAAHELSLIFERSYRTNRARSRETGGAGLGLAIARWITEMHGGTITAESQIGTGSVFRVTLPTSQGARIAATDVASVAAII